MADLFSGGLFRPVTGVIGTVATKRAAARSTAQREGETPLEWLERLQAESDAFKEQQQSRSPKEVARDSFFGRDFEDLALERARQRRIKKLNKDPQVQVYREDRSRGQMAMEASNRAVTMGLPPVAQLLSAILGPFLAGVGGTAGTSAMRRDRTSSEEDQGSRLVVF